MAHSAHKRPFASVSTHVIRQRLSPRKLAVTNTANEPIKLFPSMQQRMPGQRRFLRKDFVTNGALEALIVRVGQQMALQRGLLGKTLVALGTHTQILRAVERQMVDLKR